MFLIEEGGYYGHPNPIRSNQDQSWTALDFDGNPDASLAVNTVADISALVPEGVAIQDGYLIDPSKFTDDPERLLQSGIRVPYANADSPALVVIGSSSNGLLMYEGGAYDGDLFVAQFNGQVGLLDLSADGTEASYSTVDGLGGFSIPLDVTQGPDGTIWVAEFGSNQIRVLEPGEFIASDDIDGDGIINAEDPFQRDATNGTSVVLEAGETYFLGFRQ